MLYKFCTQHLIFHSGSLFPENATQIVRWSFAAQRQWIQILLSAAGVAIEDKIGKPWVYRNFLCMNIALCFSVSAGSNLQGFVIPYQISSSGWPGVSRAEQNGDGAGAELGATGITSAARGWYIPSRPLQVLSGDYVGKPPYLFPSQSTWAAVQVYRLSRGTKLRTRGRRTDHLKRIVWCLEYMHG